MHVDSGTGKPIKSFSVSATISEVRDFVRGEYDRVSKYTNIIYDTRDRFFANYMTVSIALFGFLGYLYNQAASVQFSVGGKATLPYLAVLALIVLIVFGIGTLFILSGNWVARDYYRQRRTRLQKILLSAPPEESLRQAVEDYLRFSRDQANWQFRITSIYFIYTSSISVSNSVGVLLSFYVVGRRLPPMVAVLVFAITFLLQNLICYVYVKLYTCKKYAEG